MNNSINILKRKIKKVCVDLEAPMGKISRNFQKTKNKEVMEQVEKVLKAKLEEDRIKKEYVDLQALMKKILDLILQWTNDAKILKTKVGNLEALILELQEIKEIKEKINDNKVRNCVGIIHH